MDDLNHLLADFFKEKTGVILAVLFGSYAKNTYNQMSDVDIAILFEPGYVIEKMQLVIWQQALSDLIKKEVDLVCLNDASPILGMQIAEEGRVCFLKSEAFFEQYLTKLYIDYAELKEIRRPMEQDILKRKYYD